MISKHLRCCLALLVVFAASAVALLPSSNASAAEKAAAASRPSIVLIIADDQVYDDFGFMGSKQAQTPNLDDLALNSARFLNAYVPTSVCRPSLATILTGLYPHEHEIFFNHPPPGLAKMKDMPVADWVKLRAAGEQYIRDVPTIPRVLAEHGYACLQTGKLWEGDYKNVGFTEGMTLNKASADPAYGNRKVMDGTVAHGNGDAGLNIGRDTMQPLFDFVDHHEKEPFFIWYAPMMPHLPYDGPERFRKPYENRADVPEHLVGYFGEITRFDDTVGQLMRFLNDKGLAENTLFIFLADNGFRPADPKQKAKTHEAAEDRSKLSPYENGIRTPLLIRWAGHTQAATHDQVVQSIDIMPTILAAAGIADLKPKLPGVDLLPAADGTTSLAPRPAFGEIYPNDAVKLGDPQDEVLYCWVRDGDLKLIERIDRDHSMQAKVSDVALYDLVKDPGEQKNLATDKNHAKDVAHLRQLLDDWWPLNTPRKPSQQSKVTPLHPPTRR